jgi:hypothetical protein
MGRALWYPTPFVVVGNFGVLRRLREMGFKTFDSFWDESYDEMWELDKRMQYIYSLIEWISNLSDSDVLEMRNGMIPIFEHNREVLKRLNEKESLETSEIFTTFVQSLSTCSASAVLVITNEPLLKEYPAGGTNFINAPAETYFKLFVAYALPAFNKEFSTIFLKYQVDKLTSEDIFCQTTLSSVKKTLSNLVI